MNQTEKLKSIYPDGYPRETKKQRFVFGGHNEQHTVQEAIIDRVRVRVRVRVRMSVELVLALIILDEFRCVSALERQKTTSVSFWMLFARGKRFLYNRSTSKKHSATAERAYMLRIAKTKQAILFLAT
jgi:hypothetical protein